MVVTPSKDVVMKIVKESSTRFVISRHRVGPSVGVYNSGKEQTHSDKVLDLALALKLGYSFYGINQQLLPYGYINLEYPTWISVPQMTPKIFDYALSKMSEVIPKLGQCAKGMESDYIYALDTHGRILFTFEFLIVAESRNYTQLCHSANCECLVQPIRT